MNKASDNLSEFAQSLKHFEHLPFDTKVFGFPFFRLDPELGLEIDEDLATIRDLTEGTFGCDAKVMAKENSILESLVQFGFRSVCEQVNLQLCPSEIRFDLDESVRCPPLMDYSKIHEHSENFTDDRLSLDSRIPQETIRKFYENWISNSFFFSEKKVYVLESGLCITLQKEDHLKIDLVSVLEKRKGLGRRLMIHVLEEARLRKIDNVRVTTEAHNHAAIRLYEGVGFRKVSSHHCLHFFESLNMETSSV